MNKVFLFSLFSGTIATGALSGIFLIKKSSSSKNKCQVDQEFSKFLSTFELISEKYKDKLGQEFITKLKKFKEDQCSEDPKELFESLNKFLEQEELEGTLKNFTSLN